MLIKEGEEYLILHFKRHAKFWW